jgi:hypothetical protein
MVTIEYDRRSYLTRSVQQYQSVVDILERLSVMWQSTNLNALTSPSQVGASLEIRALPPLG